MNHWPTVDDPRYSTRMRRAMHGLEEFRLWACGFGLEVIVLKHGDEWHMRRDGKDIAEWHISTRSFSVGPLDRNAPLPWVSSPEELRKALESYLT